MTINLFQTREYQTLMQEHITRSIEYLFSKNQEFAIACEVKYVTFEPELPKNIKETFNETVLFVMSRYTYESAKLEDDFFSFEAGFGEENFGSTVSVPLLAIKQLFVGDNPIVLNLSNPTTMKKSEKELEASQKSSMETLLNNPKNKKLLQKKK